MEKADGVESGLESGAAESDPASSALRMRRRPPAPRLALSVADKGLERNTKGEEAIAGWGTEGTTGAAATGCLRGGSGDCAGCVGCCCCSGRGDGLFESLTLCRLSALCSSLTGLNVSPLLCALRAKRGRGTCGSSVSGSASPRSPSTEEASVASAAVALEREGDASDSEACDACDACAVVATASAEACAVEESDGLEE